MLLGQTSVRAVESQLPLRVGVHITILFPSSSRPFWVCVLLFVCASCDLLNRRLRFLPGFCELNTSIRDSFLRAVRVETEKRCLLFGLCSEQKGRLDRAESQSWRQSESEGIRDKATRQTGLRLKLYHCCQGKALQRPLDGNCYCCKSGSSDSSYILSPYLSRVVAPRLVPVSLEETCRLPRALICSAFTPISEIVPKLVL